MGLFDGITDLFDNAVSGLFGTAGSYLGGSGPGSSSVLSLGVQPYSPMNFENPFSPSSAYAAAPPMSAAVVAAGGTMVAVGRSLATKFPSLYAAIVALSQQFGRKFTPEMVWRMLKMQGPGMVVGLIGAAAMNELFVWKTTHKTRRMNPANTKALRRSLRRLKSFDRLSHRVSSQLHRGGRRRSSSRTTQVICGTCRKSPCRC